MEVFLSTHAGDPKLVGSPHDSRRKRSRRVTPPLGFIAPLQAVGTASNKPYLADQGYNGQRWISHWQTNYQATVITVPVINEPARNLWSDADKTWLASHRQIVDTVLIPFFASSTLILIPVAGNSPALLQLSLLIILGYGLIGSLVALLVL